MKKLFFALPILAACAVMFGGVSPASAQDGAALTLTAQPDAVAPGGHTTLSGNLSFDGAPVVGAPIYINEYLNSECAGESFNLVDTTSTNQEGNYSLKEPVDPGSHPGEVWLRASWGPTGEAAVSPCVPFFIVPPAAGAYSPPPSGSFLCYSLGGNPLYAPDEATTLADLKAGNWLPEAVPGNVPAGMGENIGAYHLDCFNAPQAVGGFGNTAAAAQYLDGNGDVLPASYVMGSITEGEGTYPIYGLVATTG